MAILFCIPPKQAEILKKAAVDGKIKIAEMYQMTSEQRRKLFETWVDKKMAIDINAAFEKAMVSEQQTALKKWAETVFTGNEKKSAKYTDVITKIDQLKELGVLNPASQEKFMEDLVATRLGATVTAEEATKIGELASKLQEAGKESSKFGTPTKEYFAAKREMENYLASLIPSSNVKVFTSVIGRGTMLFSLKSPLLNIESNTLQALAQSTERRIANWSLGGVNNDYATEYRNYVIDVYKSTGYDISRMESLDTGKKSLGEDITNTQGKGIIKKWGRVYEDIIFDKLLTLPDVIFSSIHFSDSANLMSTKLAKKLYKGSNEFIKAKSLEIFQDATKINPETDAGKLVRKQAIEDAKYATYTNDSISSQIALGIRRLFNIASGDLRIGDQIMPFVKTPANVIQSGLESSGVTIPIESVSRLIKTINAVKSGDTVKEALGENFKGFSKKLVRAGIGMSVAFLLASIFEPEDFIGEYPVSQKERELLKSKNATTNSVKIGGKWVSLDYFGVLGSGMVGYLYAKKYGKTPQEKILRYYEGVGKQAAKIPGFTEFSNFYQMLSESNISKGMTAEEIKNTLANAVSDFAMSRIIPAFVYDIAKATDKNERQVDYTKPLDKFKSKIPGLRDDLPEKYNVFGKTIEGEGWLTVLTGSRVKTAESNDIINELTRLEQESNLPSITDVSKTSPKAKYLKNQIGQEKFDDAMKFYGKNLEKELNRLIKSSRYTRMKDEDKKKEIESIKSGEFEVMLNRYRFDARGYKKSKQ